MVTVDDTVELSVEVTELDPDTVTVLVAEVEPVVVGEAVVSVLEAVVVPLSETVEDTVDCAVLL